MSIRFKLTILLGALFFTSILNSIFTFKLEAFGEDKLKWVMHTHEVINTSQKLLSAIKDAETGQRGFLLTENPSYLEPYYTGVIAAKEHFYDLKNLTEGNLKQQELLVSIEKNMVLKFAELSETVDLAQNGDISAALAIVTDNKGKLFMNKIRQQLSEFTNAELVLLEQRKGDFRQNRAQITTLVAVEFVVFIGLALFTIAFLQRSFFAPLRLLLQSAKIVESGAPIKASDIVEKNEMGHLLSTFIAMSDKVFERERVLSHKAEHDELTGLQNKSNLLEELDARVQDCCLKEGLLAVIFLDLNSFKQINDNFGHEVGDLVLQETATRLTAAVRSSDMLFRVGGDEFLIIAGDIKQTGDIHRVIKQILLAFESPANIRGETMSIDVSIGASIAPEHSIDSKMLIRYADTAMYVSKRDSQSSYKLFNSEMLKRSSDLKTVSASQVK